MAATQIHSVMAVGRGVNDGRWRAGPASGMAQQRRGLCDEVAILERFSSSVSAGGVRRVVSGGCQPPARTALSCGCSLAHAAASGFKRICLLFWLLCMVREQTRGPTPQQSYRLQHVGGILM